MRKIILTKGILAVFFLGSCHTGPMIHKLEEPKQPFGANVEIEVSKTGTSRSLDYEGELIEVSNDGLVFSSRSIAGAPSKMTFAPWRRIRLVEATELPGIKSKRTGSNSHKPESIEMMRIVSRFPQGLSPDLMEELLASFDQVTIDSLP
jgi:hypothetical protein